MTHQGPTETGAAGATRDIPGELLDDTDDIHFVPPGCQRGCPVGTDVPSYLALIWEGKLEQAFEAITATNPFSSVCGYVCAAPCETICRRADSDGALAIRNLKRYVMERLGDHQPLPAVAVSRTETVGIVGGGPGGLTAAHDLALAGYAVHVYESSERLGGMMAWGIPAFLLPAKALDEDIERMMKRCPGIEVHLGRALGEHVTLDELKQRHDAVLLAIGLTWGKKLPIPGGDNPRIMDGVGFLHRVCGGERPDLPDDVLVIGGGDVAIDVARSAVRLGAGKVRMMCLEGRENMPAQEREVAAAEYEGIEILNDRLPVEVLDDANGLRLVRTEGGGLDENGQLRFSVVEGSEHDVPCGAIIAAIGQAAACGDLEDGGLMERGRVLSDFETMRTGDSRVFAAGDGAFGGSSIVMAMHHGHKAAYYIKAFLERNDDPMPYRTPYRTRRLAVAQDIMWSRYPRHEQSYLGLGDDPAAFAEAEAGYDAETARAEAARCFRCDAETGSANYPIAAREDIFAMARTRPGDDAEHARLLQRRLRARENPIPEDHAATFDDLVFMPANLSRLVIDPYREACSTVTEIIGGLRFELPFLVTGFDDTPGEVREALAESLRGNGCGYIGAAPLGDGVPWLQLVAAEAEQGDAAAAAVIANLGGDFRPARPAPAREGQLLGLAVQTPALEEAIPFALEHGFEMLLLDATTGIGGAWPELAGAPDLTILRQAIVILRRLNREEDIDLVYFGGIRSGTDAAKALALGGKAVLIGVTMALAVGGAIDGAGMVFAGDRKAEERVDAATQLILAMADETSIMARCTGKTNIHNLEPEDLKTITLAASEATGIPLAGTR